MRNQGLLARKSFLYYAYDKPPGCMQHPDGFDHLMEKWSMQTAEIVNITPAQELQSRVLYEAGCEIEELLNLLDAMAQLMDEDWTDPIKAQQQMCSISKVARRHAACTLLKILRAEGGATEQMERLAMGIAA